MKRSLEVFSNPVSRWRGWGKIPMVSPIRCVAMDEPRVQAYLSLIQEFFGYPNEENTYSSNSLKIISLIF
ncbi:hypothetical protein H6G58_24035 [Arthrospira platensis FACHB-971]|nr:hypothetical protein AP285_02520 [Arthrospira platensis YZ]AMW29433.1 hypothetical protein AP285_17280 [Arthrospira platensis YZ]MBD2575914.1 hypothetical protein [Arthrospira platensis FACHB-971]MBD2713168.1 hypothetical protein [Arthrospira platensis FACHB-835]BAI88412.1 hypothetical protein NIES39_A05740 [Arthrospira platensis NIES-39]